MTEQLPWTLQLYLFSSGNDSKKKSSCSLQSTLRVTRRGRSGYSTACQLKIERVAHRSQLPSGFSQFSSESRQAFEEYPLDHNEIIQILTWGKAPSPRRGIYWVKKVKARKEKCLNRSSQSRGLWAGAQNVSGSRLSWKHLLTLKVKTLTLLIELIFHSSPPVCCWLKDIYKHNGG